MAASSMSCVFSKLSSAGATYFSPPSEGPPLPAVAVAALARSRLSGSTLPSLAAGLRFSSSVPGGWIGSYSSVASRPASLRMMLEPPGWLGRKSVTS